jgi:hypothetical protein
LHLKTTDLQGKNIEAKTAVLERIGKAFLLPLDVILGWIFTNDKRQRIFNRASNTIVIKLIRTNRISSNCIFDNQLESFEAIYLLNFIKSIPLRSLASE